MIKMFFDWFWQLAHTIGYQGRDTLAVMRFCTGGKVSLIWLSTSLAICFVFWVLKKILFSPLGQLLGEFLLGTLVQFTFIATGILLLVDWLLLAACCLALYGPFCLLWFIGFDLCWSWCWYKVYEALN